MHVAAVANAYGYEVQLLIAGVWTSAKYSQQARTITLTGLTIGTVYNVRVRALGAQHRLKRLVHARLQHRGLKVAAMPPRRREDKPTATRRRSHATG